MTLAEARDEKVLDPSGGANQIRVRAYNERLVLSLVRRHESLPKSEIARRSGLSPQTVSVIMRSLEKDGLLVRGEPQRGRVGQPSIPMSLDPEGVFSLGLKVGRRSADLILVDFLGRERMSLHRTYQYPMPGELLEFAQSGVEAFMQTLTPDQRKRVAGIGISTPFELWNWADKVGVSQSDMDTWRDFDFRSEVEAACGFPAFLQNDATAACGAELVFGRGSELADFIYIFIGTFIGGGIVLNHSVYTGRTGNAGALGPMPVTNSDGTTTQLIDHASIFTLETMLMREGIDPSPIWLDPDDWSSLGDVLDKWIKSTAKHVARVVVSACSLIDFEAAVIDGAFPRMVRRSLVRATIAELEQLDLRGIAPPDIHEGNIGAGARALGGASLPLFDRYLLDQNVLFKEMT